LQCLGQGEPAPMLVPSPLWVMIDAS
jgi:hypothetical protein